MMGTGTHDLVVTKVMKEVGIGQLGVDVAMGRGKLPCGLWRRMRVEVKVRRD